MVTLVAYDKDSDSETDELNSSTQVALSMDWNSTNESINSIPSYSNHNAGIKLFEKLPKPKRSRVELLEEQDEYMQKKENSVEKPQKRIKIIIPALTEFVNDDDELTARKPKQQVKASGLFALLPAPKVTPLSSTSFVPNILQKKENKKASSKSVKLSKEVKLKLEDNIAKQDSDSNDDDIKIPETYDDETWLKVCGKDNYPKTPTAHIVHQRPAYNIESAPEVDKPYSGLDNRAFKVLVGSKKKAKDIKLIDIQEDEIRPHTTDWLKSLTDPNWEPKVAIQEPVNNTCRVKNHITALAQRALANDKELQIRWAETRHNRKQTQAKYGF